MLSDTSNLQSGIGTASLSDSKLRRKLLNVALTSPEFKHVLSEAASSIRSAATSDATEATIEGYFERVVYAILREIGLAFHPKKETAVEGRRHLTKGRTDSRLGALVIEYKRPSLLSNDAQVDKAITQLSEYLIALSKESEGPLAGILTNGIVVIELRAINGEVIRRSPVEQLDASALLRFTQLVISLALTALTSANLIRDFCGSQTDGVLFHTARLLENILGKTSSPKTDMLRSEWEELFRLAHDDQSQQKRIEERRTALGDLFQCTVNNATSEYRTLFALHTAYAIVLKFLAYRVVSDVYFGKAPQLFRPLTSTSSAALRGFCSNLEDGEIFRQLGIVNLLEGDFFSWYCDKQQWTPLLSDAIREIVAILARYEEAANIFRSDEVTDLFRDLYQAAVPRVVRSSFGEFYTPYWLAEYVLDSSALGENWRALDPCCGSGTFIIAAIARLRREATVTDAKRLLEQIVSRVMAIDLNPLSVLTSRIQYFIHISDLTSQSSDPLVIPVYLGDATAIPDRVKIDGVDCLRYQLKTLKTPIDAALPISLVQDTKQFMPLMLEYERQIQAKDNVAAEDLLMQALPGPDRTTGVKERLEGLTQDLIALERKGWNGIWARILSNFLTTACLGKFDSVIGNPPWIDWKNLPAGYRERIKSMCIDRGLFSGAGRTGGINLNVCALIAHVSMSNWLGKAGRLAFLMPRELANQASYEGWRELANKWHFIAFHDWSHSGHPFDPVKEDFMTFVIGSGRSRSEYVPVFDFEKRRGDRTKATDWKNASEAARHLEVSEKVAGQIIPESTAFTIASNEPELDEFALIAGECAYIGREGIEFYPQELLLFQFEGIGPRPGTVWLRNVQVAKSKYKIPHRRILLETRYLHPLVKGPAIDIFHHNYEGLIVAFPYESNQPLKPLSVEELKQASPLLLAYYNQAREIIEKQTKFSDKIRGVDPGEFYGLARTGPYSFSDTYVAFRDNTRWCATVVGSEKMPWKERRRYVFQNHAVSMCERIGRGGFIAEAEAHYVCAILNATVVSRFIVASSDERSYKIRPPVYVPLFDEQNQKHRELSDLSRRAHKDPSQIAEVSVRAEKLYLSLCKQRRSGEKIGPASKPLSLYPLAPEEALRRAMRVQPISNSVVIAKRLEAAEADVQAGRVLGPFGSAQELMRAVEKRTRARYSNE
jgi:hypothetical protein